MPKQYFAYYDKHLPCLFSFHEEEDNRIANELEASVKEILAEFQGQTQHKYHSQRKKHSRTGTPRPSVRNPPDINKKVFYQTSS